MKKYICSFIAISMFGITSGFAAAVSVPTKKYVDDGLIEVYRRAKNLNSATQTGVNDLAAYVGTPSDPENPSPLTLTQQIENLSDDLDDLADESTYIGNYGVSVTDDKTVSVYGLSESTKRNNKIYVFKNNVATELEIEDTWSVAPVDTVP